MGGLRNVFRESPGKGVFFVNGITNTEIRVYLFPDICGSGDGERA